MVARACVQHRPSRSGAKYPASTFGPAALEMHGGQPSRLQSTHGVARAGAHDLTLQQGQGVGRAREQSPAPSCCYPEWLNR
jgi:hypothetical protein